MCVLNGFEGFSECIDWYVHAGNLSFALKSTSNNYVRHLGRPEKVSITDAFAGLDVGQPRFRPQIHSFTLYDTQLGRLLSDIQIPWLIVWSESK